MSRIRIGLLATLMVRGFLAIGIVCLLESLFFWRGLLVKFGGEKMLSFSSQLTLTALIFLIFCAVVLPIVYQWAKYGKLNLFRCMALGIAVGTLPVTISVLHSLIFEGALQFTSGMTQMLQFSLEFSLPVAGLFWVFGAVFDALLPGFDDFLRDEG